MRRVAIVVCFCFCFWSAPRLVGAQGGLDQRMSELSKQIADRMSAKQKTTIAVVEFTDLQGNVTDFGRFELVPEVPVNATVKFVEVSGQASKATLDLAAFARRTRFFKVTFRNVAVVK